jgi:thiol-disulfide isomerase/thioredoxin
MKRHRMSSRPCAAICASLFSIALLSCGAVRADDLPRYKFTVGQELHYQQHAPPIERDDGRGGKYTSQSKQDWTLDIIRRNDDGTWRIVALQKNVYTHNNGGQERSQESFGAGYFDLAPDGKMVENPSLNFQFNPTALIPLLPEDAETKSWSSDVKFAETKRHFSAAPGAASADKEWSFHESEQTPFDEIYLVSTDRDFVLDHQRGLITKMTTTTKQGWPAAWGNQPTVSTTELANVRQLEPSEVEAIDKQSQAYFTDHAEYQKLMERGARENLLVGTETMRQAESLLKRLGEQLTVPAMQEMAANALKEHARYRNYLQYRAANLAKLMDKPSPDWKTVDLDDGPRGLEDYRGKVVLLDFWYRGCGWCIRSMPQLNQLTSDFSGQDVAVLGINSDEDKADASFVVDKMKLSYPTLKNGQGEQAINRKYFVNGWPTLIVLDRRGYVRLVHFGYAPTLRQMLGDKIRELLAEDTKTSGETNDAAKPSS